MPASYENLSTNAIQSPALNQVVGLAAALPVATPRVPQLELVLGNYGSQFIKPILFNPGDYPQQPGDKFAQHTPYPTRDNAATYAGKPVVALVTLSHDSYVEEQYDARQKAYVKATRVAQRLDLGTVLLDVAQSKNIVTTSLNGRNGTVKEYISDGDFAVTIRGALVNPRGTAYPEADMKKLLDLVKAPVSLKVTSTFLALFPIHNLVVMDYSFPQKEGFENTQYFELQCASDNPIELVKL